MSQRTLFALLLLAATLFATGCTQLAEDVATHLVRQDFKAVDHDMAVFKADLALFRECLKERGGSCQGATTTPLTHSSQHAASQPVTPVAPGSSQTLTDAVHQLPASDPAKTAHAVLSHPVVKQAAALHNHLRGHDGVGAPGVSITSGQTAGSPSSTVTMDLKIGHGESLHHHLLASIGDTAWDSLHKHCKTLVTKHQDDTELAADCRTVSFIRGYLGAYFRNGEFLEVDVKLTGLIQALNDGASKLEAKVQSLQDDVQQLEQQVDADKQQAVSDISSDAGDVGSDVTSLLHQFQTDLSHHLGPAVADIFGSLSSLGDELSTATQQLASAAETEVDDLADDIDNVLSQIDTALGRLQTKIGDVAQHLVGDVDDQLQSADTALGKVFKVSNIGFVSRDATFSARLPTIQVTLDPTAKRWVSFKDADSSQALTSHSDLGHLGVVTDTSGLGTGGGIGAELLRVFLEAVFDAAEGLPAVYPANTPSLKPTGLTLGDHSLPQFTSPMGDVDAGDLTKMTHVNDRVAAQTQVILGRAIQGIGPFSLNNRALEDFLTELIATSVRKAAEKASWCFYACDLNVDIDQLKADVEAAAKAIEQAAEQKVKAEEEKLKAEGERAKAKAEAKLHKAEQRAQKWAKRQAEQVRLRLKLSK